MGDDGGGARGLTIHSRSGVPNTEIAESAQRRADRLLAVVHVVGGADRMKPGDDQRLGGGQRGIEPLAFHRMPGNRLVEAALQIAEQHVGPP
jgi:hypothetical protein